MPRTYFPELPKFPDPGEKLKILAKNVESFTGRILGLEEARRKLFETVDESVRDVQRAIRQRR